MQTILVTGSNGFVGRNLCETLSRIQDLTLYRYDIDSDSNKLEKALEAADIIFHLAGVNRPTSVEGFQTGNSELTYTICRKLVALDRSPKVILSSSIQAELDNPYGASKRAAEEHVRAYCAETGADGVVYRLKNLFGKWCRPNYNSVTATFCHNIANGLPIQINNPRHVVDLMHIDDVVAAFVSELAVADSQGGFRMAILPRSYQKTIAELAALIQSFHDQRLTLQLPDGSDPFIRALHSTYLSYLPEDQFKYALTMHEDPRGSFTEFIKTPERGQVSINISKPGITKGNHWHHTKNEKFLVVSGRGVIRFRKLGETQILEYPVSGQKLEVVDIPPGYIHNLENFGDSDMVTVMWANEVFDHVRPDTYPDIL